MKIDSYPLLDEWISALEIKSVIEILKVLKILKFEGEKYGSNVFITPYKAFHEIGFDQITYESILFNLSDRKIIDAVSVSSVPTLKDSNNPYISVSSISENINIIRPRFDHVFNLLQVKIGYKPKKPAILSEALKLELRSLRSKLPNGGKHNMTRKFIDKIINYDGNIPDYVLAQTIKPTTKTNNYKFRKLNKDDYINDKSNLDLKIRNHLKTLNPLLKQINCRLGLNNGYWVLMLLNTNSTQY